MSEAPFIRRRLLWSIAAVAAGAVGSWILVATAPRTEPAAQPPATRIVQVVPLEAGDEAVRVTAFGTVVPARQVAVEPEVRGRIVRHHPALVPGGRIAAGEELVGIDPADYELALAEQEALLEEARFEAAVEAGRQVVASREWNLLERDLDDNEVNRSLVLREPHLRRAQAALERARNAIAQAQLDLARTSITAPFNAVVLEESVEVGQLVDANATIATLAGTDAFWVRATLPIEKLRWIRLPTPDGAGALATVRLDTGAGTGGQWDGEVVRLLGDLETTGRMARLLVEIRDPLATGAEPRNSVPLLIGSYVQVEIDAGTLENVLTIPRTALREGDRLWSVDAQDRLRIHETEVLWPRGETLLVANTVPPGERLVVSGLRVALPGMEVTPRPAPGATTGDPDAGPGAEADTAATTTR